MKTPLGTEVDLGPGHIVLDAVPALRERGTAAPRHFGPYLLLPRSPISATAELLYKGSPKTELPILHMFDFWATVCKTVRPMLSVRCPVCLSVCL